MKPKIKKMYNGRWECMIPEDRVPDDNATEQELAVHRLRLIKTGQKMVEWFVIKQEEIDEDDKYFNWEEADYMKNRLFYENDLEHLEELPQKEKM